MFELIDLCLRDEHRHTILEVHDFCNGIFCMIGWFDVISNSDRTIYIHNPLLESFHLFPTRKSTKCGIERIDRMDFPTYDMIRYGIQENHKHQ